MQIKRLKLMVGLILMGMLSACANHSHQPIDPSRVQVVLTTDPTPVQTSEKVILTAQVTGAGEQEDTQASFEVRMEGKDKGQLIEAKAVGSGKFSADYVFNEAGTYAVYTHLHLGDTHIMKKSQLTVSWQ